MWHAKPRVIIINEHCIIYNVCYRKKREERIETGNLTEELSCLVVFLNSALVRTWSLAPIIYWFLLLLILLRIPFFVSLTLFRREVKLCKSFLSVERKTEWFSSSASVGVMRLSQHRSANCKSFSCLHVAEPQIHLQVKDVTFYFSIWFQTILSYLANVFGFSMHFLLLRNRLVLLSSRRLGLCNLWKGLAYFL